ncbi:MULTISPECIES: hypothetical protein [Aeromonas]|jgi:hypothetical protein|uniref:Uncharacterized protein n=1 Tax=Aeromonas veronii TaxID=654 RepID=A0A2T4MW16_AERVE|nr:hypothetical protein [Aeromonas veronii]AXV19213.1 hypothetical protein C7U63_03780 [Aeromonas veronii]MBA2798628.1 hypothetical protein [Aeromonas veronii]MCF5897259.1 hypothetical protein [Aeromonas veronii]PTH78666.1 hypothetical protein DAA48_22565 [Aeromonas veronii]RDE62879.1 hypothetical protein DV708_11625 [Aeromonas veronii]
MQRYCSGDTLRFFMGAMLVWTGSNYPFWGEVATEQADCAMKRSALYRRHYLSIPAIGYPGLAWPGWIGIMAACRIEEIV